LKPSNPTEELPFPARKGKYLLIRKIAGFVLIRKIAGFPVVLQHL